MVPSIVSPIIYHLLSRIWQKISLYKSRKHHLCKFSHIHIPLFCTSHHCSADTYDNIYKCFLRVQDTDHVDAGTANKHPSIMCPVIEPIRVSSCSCHDRCKISLPSCRLKPPSPKPVKRKRKGQKKIKLAKKDLSSNSGTNVPRHLSEKLEKKKIAMHKAIRDSMKNATKCLHRTKDPENDKMHQMPVCLICDRFIIGADRVHRMSAKTVKKHMNVLSSQALEEYQNSPAS